MSRGIKVFFVKFGIFVGLLMLAGPVLADEEPSTWDFDGQLIFDLRYLQKPSANSGMSTFAVPWMSLSAVKEFDDESQLTIEGYGATPTNGTTEVHFRRVSFRVPEAVGVSTDLEVGLIENGLFDIQSQFWPLRRLATEMQFPLQRWGYLPDTDYGLQFHTLLGDNWTIGLQATNGEGLGQSEAGQRKDLALWMAVEWSGADDRNWLFSLLGVHGSYENIDASLAAKDRASVGLWTSRFEGWSANVEYDWAADPADAINGIVAEGVDLTTHGGERVQAQGYSGHLRYDWRTPEGKKWSVFTRTDHWEPIKGEGDKAITSSQLGLSYSPRPLLTWAIYNTQTAFADNHSTPARDQQSWRASVDLRFH